MKRYQPLGLSGMMEHDQGDYVKWSDVIAKFGQPVTQTKKPLPEYGELMTIAEFKKAANRNGITPDDGCGYYATATEMYSDIGCWSGLKPADATHVVWFNN